VYKGKKYNIANFINRHPGGTEIIIPYKDKDITVAFDHIGHSDDAKTILKKRLVNTEYSSTTDSSSSDSSFIDRSSEIELENETISKSKFLIKKLFTEEDKFNVHKIFGLLSLLSYLYRYFYILTTTGRLGIENDFFSYLTLAIHTMLSLSSFIFHVLTFRIIENPLIIYEEYRVHAILFTLRAILVSVFGLVMHLIPVSVQKVSLIALVLSIHLLVDYVTIKHGRSGVTAVRVANTDKGFLKFGKLCYSYYQFLALACHLIIDQNLKDLGFNAVIAIQSSAFLMTLKRKNIIEWYTHAFFYSFALFLSMVYMFMAKGTTFFIYVGIVFTARISLNFNKYPLWLVYILTIYLIS
jgi:hypothetical protein